MSHRRRQHADSAYISKGYKSREDVEVSLSQLVVLFEPNAAPHSNLLDALQLLSKLGTSRTVKEAFDPPYRDKPLESFTIGQKGIKGLLEQERLSCSIEADLNLSDAVVETVNRQILEMRRPHGEVDSKETKLPAPRQRTLSPLSHRSGDAAQMGYPARGR